MKINSISVPPIRKNGYLISDDFQSPAKSMNLLQTNYDKLFAGNDWYKNLYFLTKISDIAFGRGYRINYAPDEYSDNLMNINNPDSYLSRDVAFERLNQALKDGTCRIVCFDNKIQNLRDSILLGSDVTVQKMTGNTGVCYKLMSDDETVFIKLPHNENDQKYYKRAIRPNDEDIKSEIKAFELIEKPIDNTILARINKFDVNNEIKQTSRMLGKIVKIDKNGTEEDVGVIISNVKGVNLRDVSQALSNKQLKRFYNTLYQLDLRGVCHRDLNDTNLIVDENNINIIDYGAFCTFDYFYKGNKLFFDDVNEYITISNKPNLGNKVRWNGLPYTNIENFENLGLFSHLCNVVHKDLDFGNDLAERMLNKHLQFKARYYQNYLNEILPREDEIEAIEDYDKKFKEEPIIYHGKSYNNSSYASHKKYTKILADALSLVVDYDKPDATREEADITMDITSIEVAKMEIANYHKQIRLELGSARKSTADASGNLVAWGDKVAFTLNKLRKLKEKYKNNDIMSKYIDMNLEIFEFQETLNRILSKKVAIFIRELRKCPNEETMYSTINDCYAPANFYVTNKPEFMKSHYSV